MQPAEVESVQRFLLYIGILAALSACGDSVEVVPRASAATTAVAAPPEPEPPAVVEEEVQALEAALLGVKDEAPQPEVAEPEKRRVRRRRVPRVVEPEEVYEPQGPTGITSSEFHSVVSDFKGLRGCLAQKAAHLPSRNGMLRVKFAVGSDGKPRTVEVVEKKGEAAEKIGDCVARRARRLNFPQFEGEPVEHIAKFVF